jgi:intracellular multiplication protein IcmF
VPHNVGQVLDQLALLTDKKSAWYQLLTIILQNVERNTMPKDAYHLDSRYLTAKAALMTDPKWQSLLQSLKVDLAKVKSDAENDKAAYEKVVDQLKGLPKQKNALTLLWADSGLKNPLESRWAQALASGAWSALLHQAKDYLNKQWVNLVWPEYAERLEHKYPLFASEQDIALADFTHFFGPGGTINDFFVRYVQPLVNINQNYWTWKNWQHQAVPIRQSVLETFIRASLIQQMFYSDNDRHLGFRFAMVPLSFNKDLAAFYWNIEGQVWLGSQATRLPSIFTWPGPVSGRVILRLTPLSGMGQAWTTTWEGPWAWFRALDQTHLFIGENPARYTVVFQQKDKRLVYLMTMDHRVNPFIPGVLHQFRCPAAL